MASISDKVHFTKSFNIDDTAVVLIDHQVGTCSWVHSIDADLLKKNVGILAKFATKTNMPLVLTSSMYDRLFFSIFFVRFVNAMYPKNSLIGFSFHFITRETNVQGLLLDVIQKEAPHAYASRTKRIGIVNAWDSKAFADAVRATDRKHLIVAGVTTDVCLVPPALSMQEEGLHVKVS